MFAKLFDNISPRNLLNALLMILLVAASFWFFPMKEIGFLPKVLPWEINTLATIPGFSLLLILSLAFSWLLAEALNRQHLFAGQYLNMLFAGLLFWVWVYPLNSADDLWSLLLFAFLIFYLMPGLKPDAPVSGRSFGSSFVIALAGLIYGDAIMLLILPLGLKLALGKFNGRTLLSLILGYGAALYFMFSSDYLLNSSFIESWYQKLLSLEILDFTTSYRRAIPLNILSLFLFISSVVTLSQRKNFNNEQKQHLNFWLFYALVGAAGFLVFANSNFWLGLQIFPLSQLGAIAVHSVNNKWLKDGLLLLPFIAFLSFFFVA